jgi:hypothetical protein
MRPPYSAPQAQVQLRSGPGSPAQLASWERLWRILLGDPATCGASKEGPENSSALEGTTPSARGLLSRAATARHVPAEERLDGSTTQDHRQAR